jgi:Zn-dependent protease
VAAPPRARTPAAAWPSRLRRGVSIGEWSRREPSLGARADLLLEQACHRVRDFWRPADALHLGRLVGVDVRLHRGWPDTVLLLRLPTYLWVLAVVRPGWSPWTYALLAVLTLLLREAAGVLPHEPAHAAAARLCRCEVGPIVLYGAAAVAPSRQTAASPRWSLAVVALAGPLVTLALAGMWRLLAAVRGPVGRDPTPAQAVLLSLYLVELLQGVFNLLPLGPLDGALALRGLRARRPGPEPRSSS